MAQNSLYERLGRADPEDNGARRQLTQSLDYAFDGRNELNVTTFQHLLDYIEALQETEPAYVTVILPEFVPRRLWQHLLHNQHALLIKGALLFKPNVVVTSVPFLLGGAMEHAAA